MFRSAVDTFSTEHQILEAVDGKDALKLMLENDFIIPDVIFLDLNMPRMDGLELLISIRKQLKYKTIPIYIYTTSNAKKDRESCLAQGATGFITKHHSFIALCKEIKNLLHEHAC